MKPLSDLTGNLRGIGLAILVTGMAFLAPLTVRASDSHEIADSRIVGAIERNLILSPGVTLDPIDVVCHDGVVSLTGTVSDIQAKEMAETVASSIKGVRSVVNRLEIDPPEVRLDNEIKKDIKAALAMDPATESWEIQVAVLDGLASLTGTVESYAEKQLAGKVAKSVPGVRGLDNDIAINFKMNRADAEIVHDIEQRLHWDVKIDDALIDVKSDQGVVTLTGSVGSSFEQARARGKAWVAGVRDVDVTGLDVEWWARDTMQRQGYATEMTDDEVRKAIQDAMLLDPRVLFFEPEVIVKDGMVTLRGSVSDLRSKQAAEEDARNTSGVWMVQNHLKVRPPVEETDQALENRAEKAVNRNLHLAGYDIDVIVANGVAHLYGTVDSPFEKQEAYEAAAGVTGIRMVRNHLLINRTQPAYVWSDTPPTGLALKFAIENELWWSPFVDQQDVEVTVRGAEATLTGSVDTWQERREAEREALEAGALVVINELAVEYGPPYFP